MSIFKYTPNENYNSNNSFDANFANGGDPSSFKFLSAGYGGFYADGHRVDRVNGGRINSNTDGIFVDTSDRADAVTLNGGDRGDILRSGSGDDTLNGGAGNDVLEGGDGNNYIDGGPGNNTLSYENQDRGGSNIIFIDMQTGITYTSGFPDINDQFFRIQNIRGGSGIEFILGDAVRNVFEGGREGDFIDGQGGGDVASYEHSKEGVTVNLTTGVNIGGDAQGDELQNIRDLLGSANADSLTGDGQNNTLDGGAGADTLTGMTGDDTYVVDDAGDTVVEVTTDGINQGNDTVLSTISFVLSEGQSIETLRLLNSTTDQDLNLTGNEFDQRLIGNAGDNVLDGAGGADQMIGGKGDDTYHVDNVHDHTVESVGGGTDTVITSVSYNLDAGREIETLQTSDATGIDDINLGGNAFDNTLIGNDGDNRLNGRVGADTMKGGGGDDTYTVDSSADVVVEADGKGSDTVIATTSYTLQDGVSVETLRLTSNAYNSNLIGNALDQKLIGNASNNTLDGGAGSDTLYGFGGNDTFVFSTTLGSNNIDHIRDFSASEDQILLATDIFTGVSTDETGRLDANEFVDIGVKGNTVDGDDSIAYNSKTGALFYVTHDGSGAHLQQFAVLDTHPALTNLNFGVPFME